MNQSVLLNSDLTFNVQLNIWQMTGFYQSHGIVVYISEAILPRSTKLTSDVVFFIEDEIELWLKHNEPDENNIIWL